MKEILGYALGAAVSGKVGNGTWCGKIAGETACATNPSAAGQGRLSWFLVERADELQEYLGVPIGPVHPAMAARLFASSVLHTNRRMPEFKNLKTWTEHLGHQRLRSFTDDEGHLWLEQNPNKRSKWAKLAREGHDVAWEFVAPGGAYTGRMLIDGEIYTPSEATKRFLQA